MGDKLPDTAPARVMGSNVCGVAPRARRSPGAFGPLTNEEALDGHPLTNEKIETTHARKSGAFDLLTI